MKQDIVCPSCGAVRCYSHCNFCGKSIYWKRDPYDDSAKSKMYESGTEIVHYGCMKKGTGKWLRANDLPNEYQLNQKVTIVRLGNSPVFKCLYCGKRDDLPIMKGHHLKDECLIKQKQEEWKEAEKTPSIVDLVNQKLDEFIGVAQ